MVTLPLLRNLNKQEAFWVGAMAGAGFAALENVIYATTGFTIWAGPWLYVRWEVHCIRSAQGWWHKVGEMCYTEKRILAKTGCGDSVLLWQSTQAWNGGVTACDHLGGARFFGELPAEIDVLGFSAAGTTLAFLIVLGLTALWIGRAYGHNKSILSVEEEPPATRFVFIQIGQLRSGAWFVCRHRSSGNCRIKVMAAIRAILRIKIGSILDTWD